MFTFEDPSEAKKAIASITSAEQSLYTRFKDDYKLFRGEKFDPVSQATYTKEFEKSFTSNEPQTLADKIIDILSKAELELRIPTYTETEAERRPISDTERFVSGCLDYADLRLKRRGEPTLQQQMAFHATVRGWIVLRPLIYRSEAAGDKVVCQIDVWDRLWVRYEIGSEGLLWVAHIRDVPLAMAKNEYPGVLEDYQEPYAHGQGTAKSTVRIYDIFDQENNFVLCDPDPMQARGTAPYYLKDPEPHDCDGPPVIIRPCGATPLINDDSLSDEIADVGESIFANNRNMYEPYNELWSSVLTMVYRGAKGAYKVFSRDGHLVIDGDPAASGNQLSLSTDKKQDVAPIEQFVMPKDTPAMLTALGKAIQTGGTSDVMHGVLSQAPLSGLAINQLRQAVATLVDRRAQALEDSYEDIGWDLVKQFTRPGMKSIELTVQRDKSATELIRFFPQGRTGRVAPKLHRFRAKLKPDMPQDELQKFMMAQVARQPDESGTPLLSDQTIMEELIQSKDPDLESDKKFEEWIRALPLFKLRRLEVAMINREADPDEIAVVHAMRLKAENEFIKSLGITPPQPAMPAGPGGAQMPPMAGTVPMGGVPPQVMPPEAANPAMMQMNENPDIQMAMAMARKAQGL